MNCNIPYFILALYFLGTAVGLLTMTLGLLVHNIKSTNKVLDLTWLLKISLLSWVAVWIGSQLIKDTFFPRSDRDGFRNARDNGMEMKIKVQLL